MVIGEGGEGVIGEGGEGVIGEGGEGCFVLIQDQGDTFCRELSQCNQHPHATQKGLL